MTMIPILQYPDPRLKRKAIQVADFNDDVRKVIADMFETKYGTKNCAALAATQLDLNPAWHITVIDLSENNSEPLCLVNGEIIEADGEQTEYEGCMSVFPDYVHERVKRANKVTVKALDREGKPFELSAEGYLARCIQHELDHLNGKIYLDRLPSFKSDKVKRKIKKVLRQQESGS